MLVYLFLILIHPFIRTLNNLPMTKYSIRIITTLLVISALVGCRKDSSNNNVETFSRIVSEKNYSGDVLEGVTLYEYSNNKISKISYSDPNSSSEGYLEYPGENLITGSYTDNYYGDVQNGTIEIKLDNNSVIEYNDGEEKYSFSYNSSAQIEEIILYESDILASVDNYIYSSGKLVQRIYAEYGGGDVIWQDKREYTYTGNEINEITGYIKEGDAWVSSDKEVYTYTSGKITKIQRYSYQDNSWVIYPWYQEYKYDTYENLVEYAVIYPGNEGSMEKTTYSYEEGEGNYRQIYYAIDFYPTYPIPNKKSLGFRRSMTFKKSDLIPAYQK